MSAPDEEVELKLRFPPARLRDVLNSSAMASARGSRSRKLSATYYDTPELELWHRRIALRIRREGGRWVQTVKGGGSVLAGTHRRLEIETVVRHGRPDLSVLPRHAMVRFLHSGETAKSLHPVMRMMIRRKSLMLEPAPGVLIEAAVDTGTISARGRRERVCELELELKSGPPGALYDIASRVSAQVPLALEHRSKAERGYALYGAPADRPRKSVPVRLAHGMTAGDAFHAIAAEALQQVHANEHGVAVSADPEYLHQMRVGMRRLRSAIALFKPLLDAAAATHAAMLRTLGARLGPARDWDVFVGEVLPAARVQWQEALPPGFERGCTVQRERARSAAIKSIKTNTYDKSMLALAIWVSTHPGSAGRMQVPVRDFAQRVLDERHRRVLKRGRHLGKLDPAELHRLRIAVKQMRYAVEFFAGLFPVRRMSMLRAQLSALQDILGKMNDATIAAKLMAAVAAASGNRATVAAAGRIAGWHAALAEQYRAALKPAWQGFRRLSAAWRD